jgi:hypothetical protein
MRLVPRRQRTWLIALLGLAVIAGASIWLLASAKSDFEKRFDQIPYGISVEEAMRLMEPDIPFSIHKVFLPAPYVRVEWTDDGERFFLNFESERLTKKEFAPLTGVNRLRRSWGRVFSFAPPF